MKNTTPTKALTRSGAVTGIKSIDAEAFELEAVVSTPRIDRDEEIVLTSGIDTADYLKNPLLLWGHKWGGRAEDVVGKCIKLTKTATELTARFRYAVKSNPFAKQVWDLVAEGFINSFSIGFMPGKYVTRWSDPAEILALPEFARKALLEDRCWCVHTKSSLVEISQCVVPSNADCIVLAEQKGLLLPDFARRKSAFLTRVKSALGPIIIRWREQRQFDVSAAASYLGMTLEDYGLAEIGSLVPPLHALQRIAEDLAVSVADLLAASDKKREDEDEDEPGLPKSRRAAEEAFQAAAQAFSTEIERLAGAGKRLIVMDAPLKPDPLDGWRHVLAALS